MHNGEIGVGAAFLAGVVSFLSPCVLPLVPGYLSFMTGLSLDEMAHGAGAGEAKRHAGRESVFFVLGFAVVFTLLGATATTMGRFLAANAPVVTKLAGAIVILFGLHMTGILPIKWLYYQKRADTAAYKPGYIGSFLMGLAFAFGWTPCIGPILSGILALAAARETVGQGMALLLVYSLGLGLPFIAAGFALGRFLKFFSHYKKHIRTGEIVAGLLLIGVGLLLFMDRMTWLNRLLPQSLNKFLL